MPSNKEECTASQKPHPDPGTMLKDWVSSIFEPSPFSHDGGNIFFFPQLKKPAHVITGTHRRGNFQDINEKKQDLLQEISPEKKRRPTTVGEKQQNFSTNDPGETDHAGLGWKLLLILALLFAITFLITRRQPAIQHLGLPDPDYSTQKVNPLLVWEPVPVDSLEAPFLSMSVSANSKCTPETTVNRFLEVVKKELSPFPPPPPREQRIPTLEPSRVTSERTEFDIGSIGNQIVVIALRWRSACLEARMELEKGESVLKSDCDHLWFWAFFRVCRVKWGKQEYSQSQSSIESIGGLHNTSWKCFMKKSCRQQYRERL